MFVIPLIHFFVFDNDFFIFEGLLRKSSTLHTITIECLRAYNKQHMEIFLKAFYDSHKTLGVFHHITLKSQYQKIGNQRNILQFLLPVFPKVITYCENLLPDWGGVNGVFELISGINSKTRK